MSKTVSLALAACDQDHLISHIVAPEHAGEWQVWLEDLGFVAGEHVKILKAHSWLGDPMVVRVGTSTYALKPAEAACIFVGFVG